MNNEKFDTALLRAYRALAHERPLPGIDKRLLQTAEAQALKQRIWRRLAPLAAAVALVFLGASGQRMHGISAPQAQHGQTTGAVDRVAIGLLRLQPLHATPSTVGDFLLDTNSLPALDADTNEVH